MIYSITFKLLYSVPSYPLVGFKYNLSLAFQSYLHSFTKTNCIYVISKGAEKRDFTIFDFILKGHEKYSFTSFTFSGKDDVNPCKGDKRSTLMTFT